VRRFLLIVLTIVVCIPASTAAAAIPSDSTTVPDTSIAPSARPNALPRANAGQKPTQAGDRGGALQYATFGLMCAGLAFIAFRIVTSSRRARRRLPETTA
jgi:hypothetical protein